ncbi:MAG: OB-fold domain-containing protein [Nitrospinota bacterium]
MMEEGAERSLSVHGCPACGRTYFGDGAECGHCGAALEEKFVTVRGKVYSYSAVHVGPEGMEAPYLLALVDLDGSGRVLGIVEGQDRTQLRVNQPVCFAGISNGGPVFRPAEFSGKSRG